MRILAIDTSLPAVSACVLDDDAETPLVSETIEMERGHGEALLPLVERIMGQVEGGFGSLDRVAVTVGPGSFTGIRIGLAAGQAIGLACKCDVVGVSTLSALATPLLLGDCEGVVVAAIDARYGRVFFAAFGSDGRQIVPPRRDLALEALRALGAGPLLLTGSGAELIASEARARGVPCRIVSHQPYPDIACVARLGVAANPASAPARPLYLKEPDVTLPGQIHVAAGAAS
jgi:tRNA threonylcarbamoyladenosine biosynthesis protein TsaB